MELQPVILESQNATGAADGATTERRTRINRPDEGRGRCKGSRASGRRKDFSQCMQQSTTPSTSNVILHRQERTEPFGPQRCRHGTKSSPRRELDVPAELLRALFGNVTKPGKHLFRRYLHIRGRMRGAPADHRKGLAHLRGSRDSRAHGDTESEICRFPADHAKPDRSGATRAEIEQL